MRITRLWMPAFVTLGSLAAWPAGGGIGDLDPSFAEHGRLGPIPGAGGMARSIESLDGGGVLVGGGGIRVYRTDSFRPWCHVSAFNFASRLREDGTVDAGFSGDEVSGIEAYDLARRADGSIVMAGRKLTGVTPTHNQCLLTTRLAVFQLGADGSLDTSFGTNGVFRWSGAANGQARSLALEPDGRIVVAGVAYVPVGDSSEARLVVLRLLANGRLDDTFGASGVHVGPVVQYDGQVRVVRTPAGAYRVSAASSTGCVIVGLTADGALDGRFGEAGSAGVTLAVGQPAYCESLHVRPNGKLLVGGSDATNGFAMRLLANGTRDHAFAAEAAIANSMSQVTAIVDAGEGRVLVAGTGTRGAFVFRLLPSGDRDPQFGSKGRTQIELVTDYRSTPVIHDMSVRADGSVLVAGYGPTVGPFVARLIGEDDRPSSGVVSLLEGQVSTDELEGRAVLHVRRSGGSDGDVSVTYRTQEIDSALAGADFTAVSGTLHWGDGMTDTQKIVVDVVDGGLAEDHEVAAVVLDSPRNAGLGVYAATIEIRPDGSPHGQIQFSAAPSMTEEGGVARFLLAREHYFSGHVCVTLSPRSGTANVGEDLKGTPATVCWEDGDAEEKLVRIRIIDDDQTEGMETFVAEISSPTGGALIGWLRSIDVRIAASD